MSSKQAKPQVNPFLKLGLELGPLIVFFIVNQRSDLFSATAIFMVAVMISLGLSRHFMKHWPVMPLVSAVVVLIFGGLTLWLHDETFIKIKPTIVNVLFGATLLIGLAFGKSLLAFALDMVIELTDLGWKKLTFRWGVFFFFLAALNEIIWRTQTTEFWVSFKVFGTMPITILFAVAQTPLILKHEKKTAEKAPAVDDEDD